MEELWKDIPNYEGIYQASNLGRIRTVEGKKTYSKLHGERTWKQRILKPKKCRDFNLCGYRVSLWKDGKHKDYLVARLVCTTWHENLIDTKMTVNHKDGNRLNNNIENLEWLSIGDNIRHGFENDLFKQNHTVLTSKKDGTKYTFRSQTLAGRFLGRNHGYITNLRLRNKDTAVSANGDEYFVEVLNNIRNKDYGETKC